MQSTHNRIQNADRNIKTNKSEVRGLKPNNQQPTSNFLTLFSLIAVLMLSLSITAQFTHPPKYSGNTLYWNDATIEIFDEGGTYLTADNRKGKNAQIVRRSKTTGAITETICTLPNHDPGGGFYSHFYAYGDHGDVNAPRSILIDGDNIYMLARTHSGNSSILVYNTTTKAFSERLSLGNGSFNGFAKVGGQVYVLASTWSGTVNLAGGTIANQSSRLRIGFVHQNIDSAIQANGDNVKIQALLIAIDPLMKNVRLVKHFDDTAIDYAPRNKTMQNFLHDKILLSFKNSSPVYSHFALLNPSTGVVSSKTYDSSDGRVVLSTSGSKILGLKNRAAFILNSGFTQLAHSGTIITTGFSYLVDIFQVGAEYFVTMGRENRVHSVLRLDSRLARVGGFALDYCDTKFASGVFNHPQKFNFTQNSMDYIAYYQGRPNNSHLGGAMTINGVAFRNAGNNQITFKQSLNIRPEASVRLVLNGLTEDIHFGQRLDASANKVAGGSHEIVYTSSQVFNVGDDIDPGLFAASQQDGHSAWYGQDPGPGRDHRNINIGNIQKNGSIYYVDIALIDRSDSAPLIGRAINYFRPYREKKYYRVYLQYRADGNDDDDNDGVINNLDQCIDTPANETVNEQGCSSSQIDSDGDGIFDSVDQCIDTPANERVNEQGCSSSQIDSDSDGVFDNVDQCSGTPIGEPVDAEGCPTNLGVEDPVNIKVSVYPNPFVDVINIKGLSSKKLSLEVYDLAGKRVMYADNIKALGNEVSISLERLTAGIYILILKEDSGIVYTKKLIKR